MTLFPPSLEGRGQLELFRSVPGDHAVRDAQDLMTWPFFSLAKSRRTRPISFRMGETWIQVEAVSEHGMATIWDADVLIWAASQLVEARDAGRSTSRLIATTPHEILKFVGRGTGRDNYERLKAALDRLQSTTVATSIRQPHQRRFHRFSWINEWQERFDATGRPLGIELVLAEWFYAGVMDRALVLTIDKAYFALTGGLERWLYRLVRKHGGARAADGASMSRTSTSNPGPSRLASASPSNFVRLSGANRCPVTRWRWSGRSGASVCSSRRSPPIPLPPPCAVCASSPVDNYHVTRPIRNPSIRPIRNLDLVRSGTGIMRKGLPMLGILVPF